MQSDPITPDRLVAHADSPEVLEQLYRAEPAAFRVALDAALARSPDRLVLRAWRARFAAQGTAPEISAHDVPIDSVSDLAPSPSGWSWPVAPPLGQFMAVLIGLALAAGTYAKLPGFLDLASLKAENFYIRHLPFFVLPAFAALLGFRYRPSRRIVLSVVGVFAAAWLFMVLRPAPSGSDTMFLSVLHVPLLLWLVSGLAALGVSWKRPSARIAYLQLTSEVLVVTGLVLVGGAVLTALTIGLFEAIGVSVEVWYTNWVVPYGAVAAPLVALYLVSLRRDDQRLAPTMARVFGPLALITLAAYLPTLLLQGANPLDDRDTLIAFNVMLVAAFVLVVLLVTEQSRLKRTWTDGVAVALMVLAILIDLIALGAIVGRLFEGGITPNRLAVLGANVLVLAHLSVVLVAAVQLLAGKSDRSRLERGVAGFLPVYAAWAAVVIFAFPLFFGFG